MAARKKSTPRSNPERLLLKKMQRLALEPALEKRGQADIHLKSVIVEILAEHGRPAEMVDMIDHYDPKEGSLVFRRTGGVNGD